MRDLHILRAMSYVSRCNILGTYRQDILWQRQGAKAIDFDDSFIYDELALPRGERRLPVEVLLDNEAIKAFEMWKNKTDKVEY